MRTLILCIAASVMASGQVGQGVNFYSAEKEIALGQALTQEFERQANLLEDPSVQQYIEELGTRLIAGLPSGAPAFPYRFQVTIGDNAAVLEPTTFPGGFVFVPANLILAARDEAELAGVLAHAIAHVAARHGTRQETRGQIASYATLPLVFMGGWSGYEARQANQGIIPLGFLKFARGYELEADRIAVETTAAAGYDPSALLAFVDRTQPERTGTTSPSLSPFPSRAERLENLRAAIARLIPRANSPAPTLPEIQERVRQGAP